MKVILMAISYSAIIEPAKVLLFFKSHIHPTPEILIAYQDLQIHPKG